MFFTLAFRRAFGLAVALLLAVPIVSHAQIVADDPLPRTAEEWYLRLAPGLSLSETDVDNDGPGSFGFNGEVGYRFTPELEVGGGLTFAEYPNAILSQPDSIFSASRPLTLGTLMGLLRWTPRPEWRLAPYVAVGPQITFGEGRSGAGLTTSLGLDYVLNDRFSAYTDFSAYHSGPDDALDGQDVDWASISFFDTFVHWGFGIRTSLRNRPDPIDDLIIEGPDPVCVGDRATFSARVDDDADRPITYTWAMGDGGTARGMSVDHLFQTPGAYTLRVEASNANGSAEATRTIRARPASVTGQEAPRVLSLTADTMTVRVSQLVRFNAHLVGSSPVNVRWTFGDGTSATEQVTVEDRQQNPCQQEAQRVDERLSQATAYDAPGTYTVRLRAAGPAGQDQRTVTIRVVGEPVMANACDGLIPRQTVYFGFDLDFLNAAQESKLQRMVDPLRRCPQAQVRLVGHTDWVDTRSYNMDLGQRRAERVKQYFVQRGIDGSRFITETQGERGHQPPCPENDPGPGCQAYRFTETIVMTGGMMPSVAGGAMQPSSPSATTRSGQRQPRMGTPQNPSDGMGYRSSRSQTDGSGYRPGMWDSNVGRDGTTGPLPSIGVVDRDGTVRSYVGEMEAEPFGIWTLVVGTYSSMANARQAAQQMRQQLRGIPTSIVLRAAEDNEVRITLGSFDGMTEALMLRRELRGRLPGGTWMLWVPESGQPNLVSRPAPARSAPARMAPARRTASAGSAAADQTVAQWTVVVASLSSERQAQTVAQRYRSRLGGQRVTVHPNPSSGRYRVSVGAFSSAAAARSAQRRMQGSLPSGAWVLEIPSQQRSFFYGDAR